MATTIVQATAADLATSYGTLYTTPALTTTVLKSCIFSNKVAVQVTFSVNVSLGGGGNRVLASAVPLPVGSSFELVTSFITLGAGDLLQVKASAVSSIDAVASLAQDVNS